VFLSHILCCHPLPAGLCAWLEDKNNEIGAIMFASDLRLKVIEAHGEGAWPNPDVTLITLPTSTDEGPVRCKSVRQALRHIWLHGLEIPVLQVRPGHCHWVKHYIIMLSLTDILGNLVLQVRPGHLALSRLRASPQA
jgi:hypothetical protein